MSKYKSTILTEKGLSLASRAANGKAKFTITRAASTDQDLSGKSEKELQRLEILPNEKQQGLINNVTETGQFQTSVVGTEVVFNNTGIKESYSLNAVAIFAKEDGTDEEILYALSLAEEPEFMPNFSDAVTFQFIMTIYVVVGRTENVNVKVDPGAFATRDYVNEQVTILNKKIDALNFNDPLEDQDLRNRLIGVFADE